MSGGEPARAQGAPARFGRLRALVPGLHRFHPRLVDDLRGYDRHRLAADCGAGLTVGIVALPLAMAFAIASGVKPEQGIFTAIIDQALDFVVRATGVVDIVVSSPPMEEIIAAIYGQQRDQAGLRPGRDAKVLV